MQPSVKVFIFWYGPWPVYIRPFLESCRWNPTIHWVIVTSCAEPPDCPENVKILRVPFSDLKARIARCLGIELQWNEEPYKLCDIKPVAAEIFPDEILGYDFWGFGDLDVIYGNIRSIYHGDIWNYDLISSHSRIVAGHFSLVRNTPAMNSVFRKIPGWEKILSQPKTFSFDEYWFSLLFKRPPWWRFRQRRLAPFLGGALLREQFSSHIGLNPWIDGSRRYPARWFWREGRLTAQGAGDREFLYLHFSTWHSARWRKDKIAPWSTLTEVDQLGPSRPRAFSISAEGFQLLETGTL